MRAGRLNRRVELYRRAAAEDATSGEDVGEWLAVTSTWAEAKPVGGSEAFSANQTRAEASFDFLIRWRADVELLGVEWRVVYRGKAYDVTAVSELGNREGLVLRATGRAEG